MTSNENFVHLLSQTYEDVTFSKAAKQLNSGIFLHCKRVSSDERKATKDLLKSALFELGIEEEDQEIENFGRLKNYPTIFLSKTHTTEAIGIIYGKHNDLFGVGIDLEKEDRELNPKIEKFFKNTNDEELPLLELWCAKEACFKALANETLPPKTLKQVWVKSQCFGINDSPKILGEWKNFKIDGYILSVAYLRNLSTSA